MELVKINEKEYLVGQFSGDQAVKLAFKIAKLIGDVVDIKTENLNLSKLNVDDLFELAKELFDVVFNKDKKQVSKNLHQEFCGDFSCLIPLLREVIRVNNFLSLFTGLNHLQTLIQKDSKILKE